MHDREREGRGTKTAGRGSVCPTWPLRTTYFMLFRIHGQGIRRATMRMEESSAALLEVSRKFVGRHFDDGVGRIRVGVVVVVVGLVMIGVGVGSVHVERLVVQWRTAAGVFDGHLGSDEKRGRRRAKKQIETW